MDKSDLLDNEFKEDEKMYVPIWTALLFGMGLPLTYYLFNKYVGVNSQTLIDFDILLSSNRYVRMLSMFLILLVGVWFQRFLDGGKADFNRCASTGVLIVLVRSITIIVIKYYFWNSIFRNLTDQSEIAIWSVLIPRFIAILIPGIFFSFLVAMILRNK